MSSRVRGLVRKHIITTISLLTVPLAAGIPDVARAASFEGTLEASYRDDLETGRTEIGYVLVVDDGTHLAIQGVDDLPAGVEPGDTVSVEGARQGQAIVTESVAEVADGDTTAETFGGPAAQALDDRTVAVVFFNFSNDTSEPFNASQVKSTLIGASTSTQAFYEETSFDNTSFVGRDDPAGDVYGWYTIASAKGSSCSDTTIDTWRAQAEALANLDGANLGTYDHVVYVFPEVDTCDFGGIASVPGDWAMMNERIDSRIIAHELGHNLGLGHANGYRCTSNGKRAAVSGSCSINEYADPFNVMGVVYRQFDLLHKSALGYFDPSDYDQISASGTHVISSIEQAPSGGSHGVVLDPKPGESPSRTYYVGVRDGSGFDAGIPGASTTGATVRLVGSGIGTTAWLVDTRPETTTWTDAPVPAGDAFTDPQLGITVKTLSAGGGSAEVQVSYYDDPPDFTMPLYRFWSPRFANAHFYTPHQQERSNLIGYDKYPSGNWTYESITAYVYKTDAQSCGARTPVFRFYSPVFNSHFYTTSTTERDHLISSDPNWNYESVGYCAESSQVAGTTPFYRFWSPNFKKHFYTPSESEKDHLVNTDPNWNFEGTGFYVYES